MADAFDPVGELAAKYRITSILPLLETCRTLSRERILRIAVFGRFKAGKSSYYVFIRVTDTIPIAHRLVVVTDESPRE